MARVEADQYRSFVLVQTDFVRKRAPALVCALLDPRRRIKLSWEARVLPVNEQVNIAQELAKQHFQANAGRIDFWGAIRGYLFQYANDELPISLDTTGRIIPTCQASLIPE